MTTEERREYNRVWRAKNREHLREYHKRWAQANKDKMRKYRARAKEYLKAYRDKNREHINAYHKAWLERFKEEHGYCYQSHLRQLHGDKIRAAERRRNRVKRTKYGRKPRKKCYAKP